MLRVLLAFTVMLSALNLNAQTDQGRWMVSGVLDADLSLDDDDDATIFSLKPGIAKFVSDRPSGSRRVILVSITMKLVS